MSAAASVPAVVLDANRTAMAAWKETVAATVRDNPSAAVHVTFTGGANLITGYRLYYMLRYAKKSGVRQLTLETDGGFWNEEATDWLFDSGVDRIVLVAWSDLLAARVAALERRKRADAADHPVIQQP